MVVGIIASLQKLSTLENEVSHSLAAIKNRKTLERPMLLFVYIAKALV